MKASKVEWMITRIVLASAHQEWIFAIMQAGHNNIQRVLSLDLIKDIIKLKAHTKPIIKKPVSIQNQGTHGKEKLTPTLFRSACFSLQTDKQPCDLNPR